LPIRKFFVPSGTSTAQYCSLRFVIFKYFIQHPTQPQYQPDDRKEHDIRRDDKAQAEEELAGCHGVVVNGLPVVERTLKEITQTQGLASNDSRPFIDSHSDSKLDFAVKAGNPSPSGAL